MDNKPRLRNVSTGKVVNWEDVEILDALVLAREKPKDNQSSKVMSSLSTSASKKYEKINWGN